MGTKGQKRQPNSGCSWLHGAAWLSYFAIALASATKDCQRQHYASP